MNNDASTGSGQVVGIQQAGIKGFVNIVQLSNGATEEVELFNVGHEVVQSS